MNAEAYPVVRIREKVCFAKAKVFVSYQIKCILSILLLRNSREKVSLVLMWQYMQITS